MTLNLSLLGLGRRGGSLALALSGHASVRVTGYDSNATAGRAAGVSLAGSAAKAAEGADLVVLAVPFSEQQALLRVVAPKVREAGVILAFSPLLGPPLEGAPAAVPAGRYFLAAHPILNPELLESPAVEPRADLFAGGLWALAPAPGCAPEAVKLVSDLAALLTAQPYFMDPAEHDGLMGGAEALPVLFAWALWQAAAKSSGWKELRKVADGRFATATALLEAAPRGPLLLNRASALAYLDAALAELQSLRQKLSAADASGFDQLLSEAAKARGKWLAEKARADWQDQDSLSADVPTVGSMLGRLFAGNLFSKKPGDGKKD
jgi:prephenate dehydrogenase